MATQCSQDELDLGRFGGRRLVGAFDGGAITSNGGLVLLAAADRAIGLSRRLADCFIDLRAVDAVRHSVPDPLRQRIFGIALGHEDLIDHDVLRDDPALTAVLDRPGGRLASKSTLDRIEHAGKISQNRHHRLGYDVGAIERLFVDIFLDAHRTPPSRIVGQIRARWPATMIMIRADSGFCRDDLMTWCEANAVQYVLGLAGNGRLLRKIAPEMRRARNKAKQTAQPARVFTDFAYRTRKSWSATRRVIGKAEWTTGAANPRFIVTNIHAAFGMARFLYEDVYCQRGEMENRLKECRPSEAWLRHDATCSPTARRHQRRVADAPSARCAPTSCAYGSRRSPTS